MTPEHIAVGRQLIEAPREEMQSLGFRVEINEVVVLVADVAIPVANEHLCRPETVKLVEIQMPAECVQDRTIIRVQRYAGVFDGCNGFFRSKLALEPDQRVLMKVANCAFIEGTLGAFVRAAEVVLVERLDIGINAE